MIIKMNKYSNCKHNGFSLVEMMVVLVMLAVLSIGIAFIVEGNSEKAQMMQIKHNLNTISKAFDLASMIRNMAKKASPGMTVSSRDVLNDILLRRKDVFVPSKLTPEYDRYGFTLAERLAEAAAKKPVESNERNLIVADMKKILANGGKYSPQNNILENLLDSGDTDILKAFQKNARQDLFGEIRTAEGRSLADAIISTERERQGDELKMFKSGIISKYLDGDTKGGDHDLASLGEKDRNETIHAASIVLWIEGVEQQSPEMMSLASQFTRGLEGAARADVAAKLHEWFHALDGDKLALAETNGFREALREAHIEPGYSQEQAV